MTSNRTEPLQFSGPGEETESPPEGEEVERKANEEKLKRVEKRVSGVGVKGPSVQNEYESESRELKSENGEEGTMPVRAKWPVRNETSSRPRPATGLGTPAAFR